MTLLTRLSAARAGRAARRRLSDELAAFVTPAERAELDLMLGRYTLEETREVRDILDRQDALRLRTPLGVGGRRSR